MIGEVCSFYGWTDSHVMAMPASRFFLMLETARKLKSESMAHACYIARSAQMTFEGFKETVSFFEGIGGVKEVIPPPPEPLLGEKPKSLKASSEEARNAVRGAFGKDTRVNRAMPASPSPHRRGG